MWVFSRGWDVYFAHLCMVLVVLLKNLDAQLCQMNDVVQLLLGVHVLTVDLCERRSKVKGQHIGEMHG